MFFTCRFKFSFDSDAFFSIYSFQLPGVEVHCPSHPSFCRTYNIKGQMIQALDSNELPVVHAVKYSFTLYSRIPPIPILILVITSNSFLKIVCIYLKQLTEANPYIQIYFN